MSFIHLHVHSEYSIVDGLIRVDDLMDALINHGYKAIALTDQCNLFAMVKFYQAAEEKGIKPIIGADVWIHNETDATRPFRMILLCQNERGYKNLTQLVSKGYLEGQNKDSLKPQIKKEWIHLHQEGLIAIANSHGSDIACALLDNNQALAETLIEYWMGIFPNRFYLEITRTHKIHEEAYIQLAVHLAEKKECPVVASNDVRFLDKDDFEAHEARVCIQEGYVLNNAERIKQYSEEQYLKPIEMMKTLFEDLPEALENSVEIANRCTLTLKLGQVFLPKFPIPSDNMDHYFVEAAVAGLKKRFANKESIPEEYVERLNTELSVLNAMGYAGYFLIVADFIQWAKKNKISVGPGRGSGAGSLVAYALEITGLDPLLYDLLFERFLNPERISMPDFDIDFCMEGRDRVIEYVASTYGRESVSQIITYGTMAAKAVIRDVGRVLGHPYGFVDKIAKLIPLELGITLEKALAQEEILKQRYNDEEEVRSLIDLAKKLEGITRNAGKHAGGVVIAPSKLTDFSPLYCDATDGVIVTQFDKNDVEAIGLVKFDFLGLRTLTIIDWALDAINEMRSLENLEPIDINAIPLDDKKSFELLKACNTTAVFQLESRGMKDLIRRLQPDVFEEIIALVALFRPGPLQSGMVDDFINRKHGRARPEYLHPKLTHILKPTYGIILYQEQVMQIAQVLAGYTLGAADILRRAMGKKKPEEMAKQRTIFIRGATERGVDEQTASHIFDLMEKFAGYGFNKSHSAAYALITYQTAWLKAHFTAAFMAAVLSSDMAHTDKIVIFIEECKNLKLTVVTPDINRSLYKFTVGENNSIIYGLGAIKGLGEGAINAIIEARKEGLFKDLFDFCARVDSRKISRRVLESLIRSGAMDCFGEERAFLMANLSNAIQASEQLAKNLIQGQGDLFGNSLSFNDVLLKKEIVQIEPWPDTIRLQGEKETLGLYLTGHPIEQYEQELRKLTTSLIRDLRIDKNQRVVIAGLVIALRTLQTKRGDKMAFITIDDKTGRQEIAIFSEQYQANKHLLQKDALIIIEGELAIDHFSGGFKMRCINVMDLETARLKKIKNLKLYLETQTFNENFSLSLNTLLASHQADSGCPVYVIYKKNKTLVSLRLGENWLVKPSKVLLNTLENLCGKQNIEVCY